MLPPGDTWHRLESFLVVNTARALLSSDGPGPWAALIAQLVKNPPAMQETPVQFLGQEDPMEKGWATHSSILGLPWWLSW